MDPQRLPYKLYFWDPSSIGGKRRQGRQRQRWIDTCSRDLSSIDLTLQEGVNIAKNREEWKFTLSALIYFCSSWLFLCSSSAEEPLKLRLCLKKDTANHSGSRESQNTSSMTLRWAQPVKLSLWLGIRLD
ncbi:hypothetical protein MHYP_G00296610 [Metynnis hypsauchen]